MTHPRANRFRSVWAGDLRSDSVGQRVRVAGWVHRRRDHGGLIFVDLRDRSGLLQLVFHPDQGDGTHAIAGELRSEDAISASGLVVSRDPETVNKALATGEIEVSVDEIQLLSKAETPPFQVDDESPVEETLRLRYRYLDLRRLSMSEAIHARDAVVQAIRAYLHAADFLEVETPILTRSTPEGARDYLVPSRLQRGSWYALPQSPQLFKQLLMIGGLERYYQIARCFRDEDLRADRQPEFTQLDIELSFVEEEDVISLCDGLLERVLATSGIEIGGPFDRMSYDQAMLRYGTDRPDRRIGMEIQDLGQVFSQSEFQVFAKALAGGGVVRGFKAQGDLPRRRFDELTEYAQSMGAKGLVWAVVESGTWRSPIAKFLTERELDEATRALGATDGDAIFIVADRPEVVCRVLGELRLSLAQPASGHDLVWIVDFPMFEYNDQESRFEALHHPFTAPTELAGQPQSWRSRAYDLVMDGVEIGGGSIRVNDYETQMRVLDALGISGDEAQARFGFLLEALRYGAPPHGGIAFGLDRIVALVCGRDSIRDVIAFPKTASGQDPLTGAPAAVETRQLRELGL
jgi:aspartyl-tRNA synthetase